MDFAEPAGHAEMIKADEETLFVIGNGPSLSGIDLHALSPFATLGMNAAYRYWREINWRPTVYACLDLVVGLSHREAIAELISEGRINTFLLRANLVSALGAAADTSRVLNFDVLQQHVPLLRAPEVTTGSHSALWAASCGYKKIIMLGVDGRYQAIVPGAKRIGGIKLEIQTTKKNPNYFFDGYQRPGDQYNIPNPRPGLHIDAWARAASMLSTAGDAKMYNANPASAIEFFPYVDLRKLIGEGGSPVAAPRSVPPRLGEFAASQPPSVAGKAVWLIKKNYTTLLLFAAALAGAFLLLRLAGILRPEASAPTILILFLIWTLGFGLASLRQILIQNVIGLNERLTALEQGQQESRRQARIGGKEN